MNRKHVRRACLALPLACFLLASSTPAFAQFGKLKKLKDVVKKVDDEINNKESEQPNAGQPENGQKPGTPGAAAAAAPVVFSESPIDPANPANLATSFQTGAHIYGLVQIKDTWRAALGKGRKDIDKIEVPIDMLVDGQRTDFQYITIKKPEAMDSNYLVLDIAPEPDKMTAYKDPGFFYAEGKGNRKIGPDQYTYNLSELPAGQHTIRFQVRSYGDVLSGGEFTIAGDDYSFYAKLREEVLKQAFAVTTMPEAKKVDKALEETMKKLLVNAGWKDVRRLVIVDKDWWNDLVEGGNSPVKSRHMAAAAAAKADDGSFYYCICTFHQQKLIDGSFGPLELTHTGDRKPILEENIDK